MQHIIVKNL